MKNQREATRINKAIEDTIKVACECEMQVLEAAQLTFESAEYNVAKRLVFLRARLREAVVIINGDRRRLGRASKAELRFQRRLLLQEQAEKRIAQAVLNFFEEITPKYSVIQPYTLRYVCSDGNTTAVRYMLQVEE